MTRRSKVWLVVTVIYMLVNLGGAVYAAVLGEAMHAAAHVALLLPGVWLLRRLVPGRSPAETANPLAAGEVPDRLTNLEQSIDAVAIEVERIGEGQRFMTRILAEQDTPQRSEQGVAEPSEIRTDRSSR